MELRRLDVEHAGGAVARRAADPSDVGAHAAGERQIVGRQLDQGFDCITQPLVVASTSLDQLRGTLVGLLQAPATKIARIVIEPASLLARVTGAYAAKAA